MSVTHFLLGQNKTKAMCIGSSFGRLVADNVRRKPDLDAIDWNIILAAYDPEGEFFTQVARADVILKFVSLGAPYEVITEDAIPQNYGTQRLIASPWVCGRSSEADLRDPLSEHLFGFDHSSRGSAFGY